MNDEKKQISTVFPREAAVLELEKLLANKSKGDHITAREVLDATGFDVDSLRERIKTWARKRNLVLRGVPNDGYRILMDAEITDYAFAKSRTAAKVDKESLRSLLVSDQSKLDEQQARRHTWLTTRAATRVARAEQDIKDTKQEFKLADRERVPLRLVEHKK